MRSIRISLLGLLSLLAGLLTVTAAATPAAAAPNFKAPYPCGQQWTYSHHSAEVRQALDFVRTDGGPTAGSPVLASSGGTAYRYSQPSGAGNYIAIDHGGGWQTYYFHLASYSVANGAQVAQGQQIGVTGSTGNSSGAHIHYEQLYNGVGQNISINGQSLAPYPGSYYSKYLTSDNGCGGNGGGTYWVDTFANATGYAAANTADAQGVLNAGTNYVYCKVWGAQVGSGSSYNHWWLRTDLDTVYAGKNGRNAYVSAYYLSRWGNDEARDNNGAVIPDC
ncbi:M23 family metallopeptidase [Streptomyces sp. BE308]|uniref:M23 family metallopeptidase n=1 Tax=Streptomyces sp. BE308 TaxID=3002529 RepID=UPI002E76CF9D|nr:M23 family metallopeptidase [Streptomyces sp. BE308]MEE1790245.1 M23 family metallopeptidase [Streptomyces sp. BE308]